MVESYVMSRSQDNPDGSYGPRDFGPYNCSGEDVTARAFDIQGPAHTARMRTDPQVVVWRLRMENSVAVAMSEDNKLWMLVSRQYEDQVIQITFVGVFRIGGEIVPIDPATVTVNVYESGTDTQVVSDTPVVGFAGDLGFRYTLDEVNPDLEYYAQFSTTYNMVDNQTVLDSDQEPILGTVDIQNNADAVYTSSERTTRIAQLGNFTDFDAATIESWWTPDKTRMEVATKLRNYLRTLNA